LAFLPIFTSPGDGVSYPVRTYDTDEDGLLHHHDRHQRRRWNDEDEETSGTVSDYENAGPDGNNASRPAGPRPNPFPLSSIGIQA